MNYSETPLADLTVEFDQRPEMPPLPGATEDHRRQGRKLAAIHRMHLMDMARIAALLRRTELGDASPEELNKAVRGLELTENMRSFGSLCGRECKVLAFHHDAEEHSIFPQLEAQQVDALTALVARLRAEHKVVHELIIRLERAAMALMFETTPENFAEAKAVYWKLEEVIRSHFGYEETQLEEAIGLFLEGL
ncbi:MAG: hemerythrin domain-containing protein [Cognatishimia sp.]|uniref:hemerythrin domain-containing protein n=1 Tax=Cognatishimia sp. TaxID=2211648 RepID=UPI003B8B8604